MWYNSRTGKFRQHRSVWCNNGLHRKSDVPFVRAALNGAGGLDVDARNVCSECGQDLGAAWAICNLPISPHPLPMLVPGLSSSECLYKPGSEPVELER
jgi:hypothetical protein